MVPAQRDNGKDGFRKTGPGFETIFDLSSVDFSLLVF